MGWSSWKSTGKNSEGSTKKTNPNKTEHMNSKGGSKKDHMHVIHHKSKDKNIAHAIPNKSKRK